MTKKLNYQQNLEYDLEYGQICRINKRHKTFPYCVSILGSITQITYVCRICGNIQDTLYNTSWYLTACQHLEIDPHDWHSTAKDSHHNEG